MRDTKNITYGAMIVGIMSLALFLDRATGGSLSPFLSLPITIPLIVYGMMFNLKSSIVVYFVSIIVSFLFSGMLPSMLMVVGYGGIALIYIYAVRNNFSDLSKNVIMAIGLGVFYWLMISFFDEYFGFSVNEFVTWFATVLPVASHRVYFVLAYLMAIITIFLELLVINIAASFMILRLRLGIEKKR